MAPMAPLGKQRAMALVKEGKLPIWFGAPHPFMAIVEQEGKLRIRQLVVDEVEARAQGEGAILRGENWMPENHYALGKPTGKIFVEAATRDELLAKMEKMKWPKAW